MSERADWTAGIRRRDAAILDAVVRDALPPTSRSLRWGVDHARRTLTDVPEREVARRTQVVLRALPGAVVDAQVGS